MPTYAIDPDQTTLAVSVRRLLTGHGTFARVTGAVRADERGTLLSVEMSIDARSLRTGISLRDAHLMSSDFLNVRRYPISMFSSQYVEQMQVDRYLIHGLLRLNGREHPVILAATLEPIDGSAGARRAHVSGALPRSAFAIPQNPNLQEWGQKAPGLSRGMTGLSALRAVLKSGRLSAWTTHRKGPRPPGGVPPHLLSPAAAQGARRPDTHSLGVECP